MAIQQAKEIVELIAMTSVTVVCVIITGLTLRFLYVAFRDDN